METRALKRDQILADLRAAILDGHLGPGDKLPSARELHERYGASRNVIRRVMERMHGDGLIDMRQGARATVREDPLVRITIVAGDWRRHREAQRPGFNATVAEHGLTGRQEVLDVQDPVLPPHYVADALAVDDDTPMVMRHVRMYANDTPVRLATLWFPAAWASGTALAGRRKIRGGVAQLVEGLHGRFATSDIDLEGRNPTVDEVALLHLARGITVIHTVTTFSTAAGEPVYVQEEIADASRHKWRFRVEL